MTVGNIERKAGVSTWFAEETSVDVLHVLMVSADDQGMQGPIHTKMSHLKGQFDGQILEGQFLRDVFKYLNF